LIEVRPTSDERDHLGGRGRCLEFAQGNYYWRQLEMPCFVSREGGLLAAYEANPRLGLPQVQITENGNEWIECEHGALFRGHSSVRVFSKPIYERRRLNAWLGAPVSGETSFMCGKGKVVDFERGAVHWSENTVIYLSLSLSPSLPLSLESPLPSSPLSLSPLLTPIFLFPLFHTTGCVGNERSNMEAVQGTRYEYPGAPWLSHHGRGGNRRGQAGYL
jgi:LGFP repeat